MSLEPSTDHLKLHTQRDQYSEEWGLIPKYREYARGKQGDTLTADQRVALKGVDVYDRADNICHPILAEGSDRVRLLSPQERKMPWVEDATVQAFLDELYIKEGIPDLEAELYYNTQRDGNTTLRVDWKPSDASDYGRVTLIEEPWWDGEEGMFCYPGDDDTAPYAVKEWRRTLFDNGVQTIVTRRIVWYEDRIEQWVTTVGSTVGWEPYESDRVPNPVIPWLKPDGSPLHIPVIAFFNAGRMRQHQNVKFGLSELSGGVLQLQDEINDAQAALTAAMRFTAFSTLVASGYTVTYDSQGNPIVPVLILTPGSMLKDPSPTFQVVRLQPGEVTPLLEGKEDKLLAACRITRTPRHTITGGDWPSGAALERAEQPAVNKAVRFAKKAGPSWQEAFHRACEIANVFGKANLNEDAMIEVSFAPFEVRDPMYVLQLEKQQMELAAQQQALEQAPTQDTAPTEQGSNDAQTTASN